jgi:hypothetical protein
MTTREEAVIAAAGVLAEHGMRDFDIAGWQCWCGPDLRHDDADVHMAQALADAGLLAYKEGS